MPRSPFRIEVILLALCLTADAAIGQTSPGQRITNDDVIKMTRAKLSQGVIIAAIEGAVADFDLSPTGLVRLSEAGVENRVIEAMQARAKAGAAGTAAANGRSAAAEKSDLLAGAKDRDTILRSFKTMRVDATRARHFKSDQVRAALGQNRDFAALAITLVEDSAVADVVLDVGYTFAWDFPFSVRHQNTSVILVSGKGTGPFSGPRGATSVASELVKALKPYRVPSPPARAR